MGPILHLRDAPITGNIPSWVDSRQEDIILTAIIAPIVTTILVGLRLYARKFITKQVGWDDWIAAGTLILCILYSILLCFWAAHGGGMHQDDLAKLDMLPGYYMWIEISSPIYILACFGYKLSILFLYIRLFSLRKWTIRITWFTIFLTSGYLISNLVVQLTGCRPIQKFWNSSLPGECIDFISSDIAFGSLNVITDFMIFALPLPALWASTLSWRDKWGATLVFLTGAIAFVASLVRFQYAIADLTAEDRTYLAGLAFLWMVLEINTGLICSCGPALKPLYRKFFAPEALDRFAPKPVKHSLNNKRNRPRSIWRISAEVDSQATLTDNSTVETTGKPQFKSPWVEAPGWSGKEMSMDNLELQDVGGILGGPDSTSDGSVAQGYSWSRGERAASETSTMVDRSESKLGRQASEGSLMGADGSMAAIERQASFV